MEGLCFYSSKYRVTKGFKFHAQPQTGAYSCLALFSIYCSRLKSQKYLLPFDLYSPLIFIQEYIKLWIQNQ